MAWAIGADGPTDLLYLSSGNPWRDISSGVGNSSAQTVDDHVLVNGRTRKRSAAGGWSEAEVCAEEVTAPRETLHGRQCGSIGKHLPARKCTAGKGT